MITKITRRKLRQLLLRETKHLNESGTGDVDLDIQYEIENYLRQGYDNNIDSIVNHILLEFPDYFSNFSHCKSAVIEILKYSSMLKYSKRYRVVAIREAKLLKEGSTSEILINIEETMVHIIQATGTRLASYDYIMNQLMIRFSKWVEYLGGPEEFEDFIIDHYHVFSMIEFRTTPTGKEIVVLVDPHPFGFDH